MRAPASIRGVWFRSASGVAAEVTGTVSRNAAGEQLYRLRFLCGLRGDRLWTEEQIRASAARWLKRRPAR